MMDEQELSTGSPAERAFQQAFGESLREILNVDTWHPGEDLPTMYEQFARQIAQSVEQESRVRDTVRQVVLPAIGTRPGAPPEAGVYRATLDLLQRVHHGLLFAGAVEACDATQYTHDTLPLSVTQIGVSLVSYNGQQGTWVQRLFRRDLREELADPAAEALAVLERRRSHERPDQPSGLDDLSRLVRRAITSYAERAILLRRSSAMWRMGQGSPAPLELLTGSAGTLDLMIEATRILEELICTHRRFVFVPRELARSHLMTIGAALDPFEYAIVESLTEHIWDVVAAGEYYLPTTRNTEVQGRSLSGREWIQRFRDDIASQVVVGVYRASELTGARLFFAHADHAHEAALIALADSAMQPARGYPTLLSLAEQLCEATLGQESLAAAVQLGYTRAGAPLHYLAGRFR